MAKPLVLVLIFILINFVNFNALNCNKISEFGVIEYRPLEIFVLERLKCFEITYNYFND